MPIWKQSPTRTWVSSRPVVQVFAEGAGHELGGGQQLPPVGPVLLRVGVHGFVGAAVHAQVGLAIASQVLGQHGYRARHWLLEDAGADGFALPRYLLRLGGIDGEKLHGAKYGPRVSLIAAGAR